MTLKYAEEIAANLERAESSIRAAKELASGNYYDFAASRAYYAAFYAATAVLLRKELEFSRHSAVIASIHRWFVKTGKLDKKHGKDLNWLFELRGVADYGATVHVSQQDAEKAIKAAEDLVDAIQVLIQRDTE